MVTISEITLIHAPRERCFDLSRSIDLHTESTARTGEQAIAGVTSGLIGMGEEVTWRARHLGMWQALTSRITAFDPPHYFQDTMVRGAFRSFQHDHFFRKREDGLTEMEDVLRFSAPFSLLGRIAEIPLRSYLRRFLRERNRLLKKIAEGEDWRKYLGGG
ncbi:MAG: SRPBCC family protein [Acidobacteriaceae bacterium]